MFCLIMNEAGLPQIAGAKVEKRLFVQLCLKPIRFKISLDRLIQNILTPESRHSAIHN